MRYGQGYGCYYGNPDNMVIILGIINTRDGVAVTFVVIAGYDQFVQLVIDGRNSGNPVFCKGGKVTTLRGSYNGKSAPHIISVEPMGPFARSNAFDVTQGQIMYAATRPDRLHLEIVAVPVEFSIDGD